MTGISYQLYSSRNFPPISGTLKMLAEVGYTMVEGYGGLFSDPPVYDDVKSGLDASGLRMASGHFDFGTVRSHPERVLDIAGAVGIEAIFVPFLARDQRPKDAAGWRAFGKSLATAAEPFWNAGHTFGWHNHDFEFAATPTGEMPLDLILAADDRVALELDIAWVARSGQDPLIWIDRYRDRIAAVHVKDIAAQGECADEDGWADVGHGILDWPALMRALRGTGAKLFVMEHDNPSDDRRFATRSLAAARRL